MCNHSEEFIAKKAERDELKLRESLIKRVKADDPRYFIKLKPPVEIKRLPGEIFKLIPTTTRYYVSNMGRALKIVYDKKADVFLEHELSLLKCKNKTGHYYYDINIQLENEKRIRCRLSRAIVKTFIDPTFGLLYEDDKRIPDHIDYNSENNKLTNLRILDSNGKNIIAAIYEQGITVGKEIKKCYAYNIDTKELKEYPSTGELCRDIFNSSNKGFFNGYNKDKSITSKGWTVGYDPDELKTRVRRKSGRGSKRV